MTLPSVFKVPHLSEDVVAALADGVLSATAAARAQRHCEECAECAAAVRCQREAAMLLRSSASPALPSGLLDRLSELPMSVTLPDRGFPTAMSADGRPVVEVEQHEPRGRIAQFRVRANLSALGSVFPSSQSRP